MIPVKNRHPHYSSKPLLIARKSNRQSSHSSSRERPQTARTILAPSKTQASLSLAKSFGVRDKVTAREKQKLTIKMIKPVQQKPQAIKSLPININTIGLLKPRERSIEKPMRRSASTSTIKKTGSSNNEASEAAISKVVKLMDSEVRPLCSRVQEMLGITPLNQTLIKQNSQKRSLSRQTSARSISKNNSTVKKQEASPKGSDERWIAQQTQNIASLEKRLEAFQSKAANDIKQANESRDQQLNDFKKQCTSAILQQLNARQDEGNMRQKKQLSNTGGKSEDAITQSDDVIQGQEELNSFIVLSQNKVDVAQQQRDPTEVSSNSDSIQVSESKKEPKINKVMGSDATRARVHEQVQTIKPSTGATSSLQVQVKKTEEEFSPSMSTIGGLMQNASISSINSVPILEEPCAINCIHKEEIITPHNLSEEIDQKQKSMEKSQKKQERVTELVSKLENYSLKQAQEVHDSLEQLQACIASNSEAMRRAIEDLKLMKSASKQNITSEYLFAKTDSVYSMAEVTETANKILFQFENFSDYTHAEIIKMQHSLSERSSTCDTRIQQIEMIQETQKSINSSILYNNLLENQTRDDSESLVSTNHTKFTAVKQHIWRTQTFLEAETSAVDMKIIKLQNMLVNEIEKCVSVDDDQEDYRDIIKTQLQEFKPDEEDTTNQLLHSHISTIPEEAEVEDDKSLK